MLSPWAQFNNIICPTRNLKKDVGTESQQRLFRFNFCCEREEAVMRKYVVYTHNR